MLIDGHARVVELLYFIVTSIGPTLCTALSMMGTLVLYGLLHAHFTGIGLCSACTVYHMLNIVHVHVHVGRHGVTVSLFTAWRTGCERESV